MRRVLVIFAAFGTLACSTAPARDCTPGTTAACLCPDGSSGAQVCLSDGSGFGTCSCVGNDAGVMPHDSGGIILIDSGPVSGPCSAANPTGTCAIGSRCVSDAFGNVACRPNCSASGSCPSAESCCALLTDGTGVCFAPDSTLQCLCSSTTDCVALRPMNLGACAPRVASDVVQGAYICVPGDSAPWHGCFSSACGTGYDCWGDARGNEFCARSCSTSAGCANPGIACCVMPPSVTCHNDIFSCGTGACMPCGS